MGFRAQSILEVLFNNDKTRAPSFLSKVKEHTQENLSYCRPCYVLLEESLLSTKVKVFTKVKRKYVSFTSETETHLLQASF